MQVLMRAPPIRQYGAQASSDVHELWRRIVFNIMISNTDDHLRNHGFLYVDTQGWKLSPAYDLNPTPIDIKPRFLSTMVDYDDGTASLELAMSVIEYFGLNGNEAKSIAHEVAKSVSDWQKEAKRLGLNKTEIARMETAFEHDDLRVALSWN